MVYFSILKIGNLKSLKSKSPLIFILFSYIYGNFEKMVYLQINLILLTKLTNFLININ